MKYNKIILICSFISMIGSVCAQDNIINEIAKGGKFIVRDVEQKEAMVIEDGNVGFSGTLKLGILPQGNIGNSIVVWDPEDKLLKLQDKNGSIGLANNIKDWHTLGYDGLADDNTTTIKASVQGTASVKWNKFSTDYGHIQLGPANQWTAHIYTNKRRFLFNKPIHSLNGSFVAHKGSDLVLRTYTTTRIKILASNGNVGIGTTNPSTKLDVAGQVKIRGGSPGTGKVLTSDASGLATWQTPAADGGTSSTLWTESGSNIYRTDGNIGIGTTNPSAKLDVNGTVSAKRYVIDGLYDITNGVWDLSQGNLAQVTYNSSITPITINSDGTAGSYILVVKKNNSCTDCNINFLGADVKYPGGVNPTLSSGSNTTDIFSFIEVGNNTFYCFYAKNLQ